MASSGADAPPPPMKRGSAGDYKNFVQSQEHILKATSYNPTPTTMPPPTAGLTGAIGERYVISFIGLPARGKQYLAERLCRYLRFFHGATCKARTTRAPLSPAGRARALSLFTRSSRFRARALSLGARARATGL